MFRVYYTYYLACEFPQQIYSDILSFFFIVLFGFFVTEPVKNWCDSIGLDHAPKPTNTINPEFSFGNACVWHWKYQLICLKPISV